MCGIVGFIGNEDVKQLLLVGLERLEYRGYDSSGISILTKKNNLFTFKDKGRISHLRTLIDAEYAEIGIGHTRWATHGIPNYVNSHPHVTNDQRFSIVHNGVIENVEKIKHEYLNNFKLISDTDTEVIAELISLFVKQYSSVSKAIEKLIHVLKGSYALVIIDATDNNKIYAVKNKSPLLIGLGKHFNMVASDALAMVDKTNQFVNLNDLEYAMIEKEKIAIYNACGETRDYQVMRIEFDDRDVEKGLYEHYMLKEIDEQPGVIRRIIEAYQQDGQLFIDEKIVEAVRWCDEIHIIAAGTSYHAGLIGKNVFETLLKKKVNVHIASEFNYQFPILKEKPLFIFISQSGETADCTSALAEVNQRKFTSISLTNAPNSTLYRASTYQLLMHAKREIAVASTKAYTASITVLSILAYLASPKKDFDLLRELGIISNIMDTVISQKDYYHQLTKTFLNNQERAFFIGRLQDYAASLEGALKLKEISYIQAEGFAAGELKHGTIALIEKDTPVMVLISDEKINFVTRANAKEVEARGGKVLLISLKRLSHEHDQIIIDDVHPLLATLVMIIPLQLIAYYAAVERGLDIDKPRNLAKSVTVE